MMGTSERFTDGTERQRFHSKGEPNFYYAVSFREVRGNTSREDTSTPFYPIQS